MSTNIVPVNNELHAKLKVKNEIRFDFIKDQQIAPVVVHEYSLAANNYPIVFVKNSETGQFQSVVLLGLKPEENLYVQNGRWQGTHIPGIVHNYPFKLLAADAEGNQMMLALDHDSDLVGEEEGEAIFDDENKETPFFEQRKNSVIQYFESGHLTTQFMAQLAEFDLFIPQSINITVAGEDTTLDGLYFVDEKKLNELSEEDFGKLRKRGFLSLIYSHLVSLHQTQRLIRLKSAQAELAAAETPDQE